MKKLLIKFLIGFTAVGFLSALAFGIGLYIWLCRDLPKVAEIDDYNPKKVTIVYDRNEEKIGEFFREKRRLATQEEIPDYLEQAFLSAEDSAFYRHNGINFKAILRAAIKNFFAGRTVQGGSTITQQVVKKIFLTDERSYERKGKEAILARRLEKKFDKDQILNLYLNHIYLGEGAYGVEMAAQTYFRKSAKDLEIKEAALLAGLTNRPSKNSPLKNPKAAKRRQRYVLFRMAEEGYITEEQAQTAVNENLKVFYKQVEEDVAPYFVETVRQIVSEKIGDDLLLEGGLKIVTSLDKKAHLAAKKASRKGLRDLDKRQGFRGAKANLKTAEDVQNFLEKTRNNQIKKHFKYIEIDPTGEVTGLIQEPLNLTVFVTGSETEKKPNLPEYIETGDMIKAIVTKVSDKEGLVFLRFAESRGIIKFKSMKWARRPDPQVHSRYVELKRPSLALKRGDIIEVRVVASNIKDKDVLKTKLVEDIESYAVVELEQKPLAQAALLSFDQETGEIISMVGGKKFEESKYNRTYQALRQTGSAFKPIVYSAGLDKGLKPSSEILDTPLVFEEIVASEDSESGEEEIKKYKPSNHSRDFSGAVILRDALVRSLNVPTMHLINQLGVAWPEIYARRLGAFSPLNSDMTLALGSSGLTLYEMTKIYSHFGRLGKKISPLLIRRVENLEGESLISDYSFDEKFKDQIEEADRVFNEKVFEQMSFGDQQAVFPKEPSDQLITPQTAYIMTNILSGVVKDARGTAPRARVLRRPVAGKTGTTSDYYDAWFMGYSAQVVTGVWVGYDQEKSLGRGETGGRAALPIWIDFMKAAHEGLPKKDFEVPEGITFLSIDAETGKVPTASAKRIVRQAFKEGAEPTAVSSGEEEIDEQDLLKEDLNG